ncbi:interleukin-6-like [Siniperca chuatsi]|uniref:Interleukin-6 n=1 Tax=Siniperca chuatsi TaxID=119488 RepID=A0A6M3YWW9_SINCH|nr:interleukin-6-like [Siniperca chuatsi]XP_044028137.1 interleukin-6-like [Siniperca chuatsi]QJI54762.1 interleukin-6 [Siniperca chuatsi]
MPYKLNAYLLSAVMLAALLQCAPGAPAEYAPTDSPAGDSSGEEEEEERPSELLSVSKELELILGATKRHREEFEDEFQTEVKYDFLRHYTVSSLPASCPYSNFSKEACLHRLAHGLPIYRVLLKYVEKECPSSRIPSEARFYGGLLISQIKEKMKNPEQVTALTSSQENKLLKDLDNPDTFHRKMTAHSILRQLHYFLVDGKRAIKKREFRASMANRGMAPVTFYYQKLKI